MDKIKLARWNNAFLEEISKIINMEIKDDDIKFVTITGCETTADLSLTKVYYTVLNRERKDETSEALSKAAPFIRSELSQRVEIRHTPALKFIYDTSIEYGEIIDEKLEEIKEKEDK